MSTSESDDKPKTQRRTAVKADDDPKEEKPATQTAQTVEIYPLRSYQDAGEIKRRGGPGYNAPKRHAERLIAAGLATDKKPKA